MKRWLRWPFPSWLLVVASLAPPVRAGSGAEETSRVLAEKLFQEAKRALAENKLAEGCTKLADSHRLDPAGGTVLLLAACLERRGRVASAWSSYHEALGFARRDGREDRVLRNEGEDAVEGDVRFAEAGEVADRDAIVLERALERGEVLRCCMPGGIAGEAGLEELTGVLEVLHAPGR